MRHERRELVADGIDVRATLRPLGVFGLDPTHRWWDRGFAKAVLTPDGPGTMLLSWTPTGGVTAEAWGTGATWLIDRAPWWVGLHDDPTGFDPTRHPVVARCWRRHPGLRLPAAGVVWQELLAVLFGQRVTTDEATRSWSRACRAWGAPAPGPLELHLPPAPEAVASRSYHEFHRLNVERRRAEAIVLAARRAGRLEEAVAMRPDDALVRLTALPGLGIWTATSTIVVSLGDPDTVVLRDDGLPTLVNHAFTGDSAHLRQGVEADEVMCGHLEPWRGHRQRIVRLLYTAGVRAPRRAPRAVNPDLRRL